MWAFIPQKEMDDHRQARIGSKREPPRTRHLAAGQVGVVRDHEEPGECHIPAGHPRWVLEVLPFDRGTDRLRGP